MVYKQIGEKIKEYRKMKSLTQEELGEKIRVSYQQVQKYEKGNTKLYVARLYQIAQALGVSVAALLSESDGFIAGEKEPNFSMTYVTKEEYELIRLFRDLKDNGKKAAVVALLKTFTS